MEAELTCGICLEYFTHPLMLPCGHNFCKMCLEGIVAARLRGSSRRHSVVSLDCPLCQRNIVLENGIGSIPLNRTLENIVDCHKGKENVPYSDSSWSCDLDLSESTCSRHNQPMLFYCLSCDFPLCKECPCYNEKKQGAIHKCCQIKEHAVNLQSKIASTIAALKRKVTPLNDRIQLLEDIIRGINENEKKIIKQLEMEILALTSSLKSRQEELQRILSNDIRDIEQPVQNKLRKYRTKLTSIQEHFKKLSMVKGTKNISLRIKLMQESEKQLNNLLCFDLAWFSQELPVVDMPSWTLVKKDVDDAISNMSWKRTEPSKQKITNNLLLPASNQNQTGDVLKTYKDPFMDLFPVSESKKSKQRCGSEGPDLFKSPSSTESVSGNSQMTFTSSNVGHRRFSTPDFKSGSGDNSSTTVSSSFLLPKMSTISLSTGSSSSNFSFVPSSFSLFTPINTSGTFQPQFGGTGSTEAPPSSSSESQAQSTATSVFSFSTQPQVFPATQSSIFDLPNSEISTQTGGATQTDGATVSQQHACNIQSVQNVPMFTELAPQPQLNSSEAQQVNMGSTSSNPMTKTLGKEGSTSISFRVLQKPQVNTSTTAAGGTKNRRASKPSNISFSVLKISPPKEQNIVHPNPLPVIFGNKKASKGNSISGNDVKDCGHKPTNATVSCLDQKQNATTSCANFAASASVVFGSPKVGATTEKSNIIKPPLSGDGFYSPPADTGQNVPKNPTTSSFLIPANSTSAVLTTANFIMPSATKREDCTGPSSSSMFCTRCHSSPEFDSIQTISGSSSTANSDQSSDSQVGEGKESRGAEGRESNDVQDRPQSGFTCNIPKLSARDFSPGRSTGSSNRSSSAGRRYIKPVKQRR